MLTSHKVKSTIQKMRTGFGEMDIAVSSPRCINDGFVAAAKATPLLASWNNLSITLYPFFLSNLSYYFDKDNSKPFYIVGKALHIEFD